MISLANYQGRTIGVFGLGKTGISAVQALVSGGAKVLAWDDNDKGRDKLAAEVKSDLLSLNPPEMWDFGMMSFVVLSPGVPLHYPQPHPIVAMAARTGCPLVSDIELLYHRFMDTPFIGITGTNGKSTTTSLIGHVLQSAGSKEQTGGNLGMPALSLEPLDENGFYVMELSSYQLDLQHQMRFKAGILLNVTPDHIDRHGSMEGYVAAKLKLFENQQEGDTAIIAVDDSYTEAVHKKLTERKLMRVIPVSGKKKLSQGVYVQNGMLVSLLNPAQQPTIDLNGIASLTGSHNWQNAAAAYAALHVCGLSHDEIRHGMETFPGLRHRLQLVATIDGVRFFNDSKATNADATSNALEPFDTIYWIAGGKPKDGGITTLSKYFPKIVHAYLIGEAEAQFAKTLEGKVPYTRCLTLANATQIAAEHAMRDRKKNAVVLLSPACASFDQWPNFEARGDAFCEMVEKLRSETYAD